MRHETARLVEETKTLNYWEELAARQQAISGPVGEMALAWAITGPIAGPFGVETATNVLGVGSQEAVHTLSAVVTWEDLNRTRVEKADLAKSA